ncbi:MAG: sodium/solute symporter [Anditalea sp.]
MKDINQYLQVLDFIVVGGYLVVLIGIGYWVSFVKKRKEGEHLFLAGNSLGWKSIGLTMWGTNVGPSMLVVSAASGYTYGIAGANFSWYAFVFIMLLAMVFAPYYHKTKVSTLPEFIGKRYNNTSREMLAWYSLITILVSWLGITLFAGGLLVSQIMGWPLWVAITVLAGISAFFAVAGGLEAIAITNSFQMVLLIVVSFGLAITGIVEAGGITAVYEAIPPENWRLFLPRDHPEYPWLPIVLGYPVLGIWFWCTDQSMVQSVLGAKNLKQGQLGTNFTGWLKIIDMPLFILPGILCFVLFPNLAAPEEAYATMVTQLMPNGMIGLVMAVLIAALVSTIDSALNSLSTIFTLDIYVSRFKPKAKNKEVIRIGRIMVLVGTVLGILFALLVGQIEGSDLFMLFQSILGFLAPPLAAVFLMGVLWKKASPLAANLILSLGSVVSIGIGCCSILGFPHGEFWPHPLLLSFYIFIGFMMGMVLITKLFGKKYKGSQLPVLPETLGKVKNNKLVWGLWMLLTVVMVGLYLFFN